MNFLSRKITDLDEYRLDAYISRISRLHFFTFSLSRRRINFLLNTRQIASRDLSVLLDHSNVQDRTGGKLSVSTGLQLVNG